MSNKPLSAAEFAEAVITHWPPFRWDQHQAGSWTQSLVRELSAFDRQVLGNALAHLIRSRRDTKTPTVAACIDACVAERRYLDAEKTTASLPVTKDGSRLPEYSDERRRLADDLVRCADGKQAAKEGWIGTLHTFVVRNGRMPKGHEIADCKRHAREFDEYYAQCVKGGWPQAASLLSLGDKMLARRKELTEMVLHGVVR